MLGAWGWCGYSAQGRQFFPVRGAELDFGAGVPGQEGAQRRRRTCLRAGDPEADLTVNGVGIHCFFSTPHSGGLQGGSGGVEGALASESLRTRVGAPTGRNLLGGSQGAEFARSWGTRRPSRGAPWALRRLRIHRCSGKGFMAARLLSHVAPRAFYMGFAWGLLGLLQPLPPSPPPLLRPTLKPKAAWVLDGGVPP